MIGFFAGSIQISNSLFFLLQNLNANFHRYLKSDISLKLKKKKNVFLVLT